MTMREDSVSKDTSIQHVTARWILTMTGPPQRGGSVTLRDGEILSVDRSSAPSNATDLGDAALLPGLINAHTHLEFSDLSSPIGECETGRSELALHDWIGKVVQTRGIRSAEDSFQAVKKGWLESLQSGTRWLGEIATPPISADALQCFNQSPSSIEVHLFCEVLGLSDERWQERLQQARQTTTNVRSAGYSPHAPYSTNRAAWRACIERSRLEGTLLAMHVAESPEERRLISHGDGPLAEALRAMGVAQQGLFPWESCRGNSRTTFVPLIEGLSGANRAMIIHGNDLNSEEIQVLARHSNLSVVYCPRTHWFFGHDKHPVMQLREAGIPVAIGTDSRASNPDLKLWSEVRHLLHHRQDLKPEDVLKMATIEGASAVGRDDLGAIDPGRRPGLGYITTQATTLQQLYRDLACSDFQPFRPEEHPR